MKKLILISLTLSVASLACLSTASVVDEKPISTSPTFVKVEEEPAGAVYEVPLIIETRAPQSCAEVIAVEALHLRAGPSDADIVLTWLFHGDKLRVISQDNSDWWLVDFDGRTGYARSIYLEEKECEK